MFPGLSDDPNQINNSRKTARINRELARLNTDIAALEETRLLSDGSLREQNYTFFLQGVKPKEPHLHGVSFAAKNSLMSPIEPPTNGTEQILSIKLHSTAGTVNILSVYAPTLCSTIVMKR